MDRVNLINRHFFRCLQAAGFKRRRYHDLRHSFASLLLTAGAPIAYVSEQMGHSSIELTVKRYGHLEPSANRRSEIPDIQASSLRLVAHAHREPQGDGRSAATAPLSKEEKRKQFQKTVEKLRREYES